MNKIVLVTGATRGIGREIALTLAQEGYTVIGTATSDRGVETINAYLCEYNGIGKVLNVTNKENIDSLIKNINDNYGVIDILINNAGVTKDNLLMRMTEDAWDEVIDTNLKSIFLLSKAVIRGMMKNQWGRIINITSVVGSIGNPGQVNYASSKAGAELFAKSLAKEVGSRNITVNSVAPGFIETDMTDKLSQDAINAYKNMIPLGRLGTTKDIANGVKYLVSDEAAYITGTTLHINGGMY
jgi:3-oxoacyl-[acyl-carrier protein] reductase